MCSQLRPAEKTVVVGPRAELERTSLTASQVNWIAGTPPAGPLRVTAQIRHRHQPAPGTVRALDDNRASMEFDAPVMAITPGQAVVFYAGRCGRRRRVDRLIASMGRLADWSIKSPQSIRQSCESVESRNARLFRGSPVSLKIVHSSIGCAPIFL